jgi:hypothetical protein
MILAREILIVAAAVVYRFFFFSFVFIWCIDARCNLLQSSRLSMQIDIHKISRDHKITTHQF